MTELAVTPVDSAVEALRVAVLALLAGYDDVARRLPEFGAPPEILDDLLAPLRAAADEAAAALSAAAH